MGNIPQLQNKKLSRASSSRRMRRLSRLETSSASWRRKSRRSSHSESVQSKVRKLRSLIPGGQGLQPDQLLLQTADYIMHLRLQVNALRALSLLYQA